jgi:hypothetical protein
MPPLRKHPARFMDRVTFRCSETVAHAVQQAADQERVTPSEYARRALIGRLRANGFGLAEGSIGAGSTKTAGEGPQSFDAQRDAETLK